MKKYVWLNIATGEFSDSWTEEMMLEHFKNYNWENDIRDGWKMIEYKCLNDKDFNFYNLMKIVTNNP